MSTDLNIKESAPLIGVRQHAGFEFTEDAITMACNDAVKRIQKRTWYDRRHGCQYGPGTTQLAAGSQHCIGALEYTLIRTLIVLHKMKRVEIFRVKTMPAQYLLGEVTLQRCKPQAPALIMPEQKLDQSIAQPANTVVQNDGIRAAHYGFSTG